MDVKSKMKLFGLGIFTLFVAGCASVPLNNDAQNVVFTTTSLPQVCTFIRQVSSSNTNGYEQAYTSHLNLITMEINSLKNQTARMGGNVVMLTGHYTTYTKESFPHQYSSETVVNTHTLIGNAYFCPPNILSRLQNLTAAEILDNKPTH